MVLIEVGVDYQDNPKYIARYNTYGRRLSSNCFWYWSTVTQKAAKPFMLCSRIWRERLSHRCRERSISYAHTGRQRWSHRYCERSNTAESHMVSPGSRMHRKVQMNDWPLTYGLLPLFQPRNGRKPTTSTLAQNPPMEILVLAFEICNGLFDKHHL